MLPDTHSIVGATPRRHRTALATLTAAGLVWAGAAAQAAADDASPELEIAVPVGQARTLTPGSPAAKVFVAGPDIADVDGGDPAHLIVYGRKPGRTNLFVTGRDGALRSYVVDVERPMTGLREAIAQIAPDAKLSIVQAPRGVSIIGTVPTPYQASAVKTVAEQFIAADESLNFSVSVTQGTQVNLQVRIAEVSREVSTAIGVNWGGTNVAGRYQVGMLTGRAPVEAVKQDVLNAAGQLAQAPALGLARSTGGLSSIGAIYRPTAGGPENIGLLIDALRARGLITVLAEPNLTATSGQRANFRAGGELPVPVVSGGATGQATTTIEWKPFGVGLEFVPTVLDERRISIRVASEVSELSEIGAVTLNGATVPALSVRKADTTVELGSGESFAIAGLFKNNGSLGTKGLPGMGDLPVIGALFRSQAFQKNRTELVVIVTPYIVRPSSGPGELSAPTDDVRAASEMEQILFGRVTHPPEAKEGAPTRPHASGKTTSEDKR